MTASYRVVVPGNLEGARTDKAVRDGGKLAVHVGYCPHGRLAAVKVQSDLRQPRQQAILAGRHVRKVELHAAISQSVTSEWCQAAIQPPQEGDSSVPQVAAVQAARGALTL